MPGIGQVRFKLFLVLKVQRWSARSHDHTDGFNLYYGALKGTPYKMAQLGSPVPSSASLRHHSRNQVFHSKGDRQTNESDLGSRPRLVLRALRTIPNLTITWAIF